MMKATKEWARGDSGIHDILCLCLTLRLDQDR
jgi:hypothetical protein